MENFYIRGDSRNLAQIISQDKTSYKLRNICSVRVSYTYHILHQYKRKQFQKSHKLFPSDFKYRREPHSIKKRANYSGAEYPNHDWGMLHSDSIATIHSSLRATNVYCQLHWLRQSCHAFIIFSVAMRQLLSSVGVRCFAIPFHWISLNFSSFHFSSFIFSFQ